MHVHARNVSLALAMLAVSCDDDDASAVAEQGPEAPDAPAGAAGSPAELDGPPSLAGSFEDFVEFHAERAPDGTWVVEGDLRIADDDELRAYYDEVILGVAPAQCEDPERCPRSTVIQTNGRDSVWSAHGKLALTYCIGDMGSTSNFNRVTAAIHEATRDWEGSADVNFIHLSALDGTGCAPNTNGALFRVRRKPSGCTATLLAQAFFPHWSPANRELEYCDHGLAQSDAELLSITKHELGHVLGLQHEHYRWAQDESKCLDGNVPGRALTYADSSSIMGYNFCNGISDDNKILSRGDRLGAHRLYNIARGHGRLSGGAFQQANSFRGTGVSDDIFWYTPGGSAYSLWAGPDTIGSGTISFTKTTHSASMETYWRPLPVQWVSNGDANLDRELLFFGPGSIADKYYVNQGDGSFSAGNITINGHYIPLIGRFHGGSYSELLWWNPGGGSLLWRTDGSNNITQSTATTAYSGGSQGLDFSHKALVGSFGPGASNASEILWYGDCYGWVTRGTGTTGFETAIVDMLYATGTCDLVRHVPLLGDFDGDNKGDIFFYGPGGVEDRLLLLNGSLYDTLSNYSYRSFDLPVNGHYKPLVGDFNGDNKSDIFWYQPGTGADPVWLFTGAGQYTNLTSNVDGDYAPLVGDFNNDGCDDIAWFDTPVDLLRIWRSDCDGTFTSQAAQSVPANAYPVGYGIGF